MIKTEFSGDHLNIRHSFPVKFKIHFYDLVVFIQKGALLFFFPLKIKMFSLKTVCQLHTQAFQYFAIKGIQTRSASSKKVPSFDEKYTEVVDRLINQHKIRRQKAKEAKEIQKGSLKTPPKPKPNQNVPPKGDQNVKDLKLTISKDGDKIFGNISR